MDEKIQHLIKELDRKVVHGFVEDEFLRFGQQGYNALLKAVQSQPLSERQLTHALSLLVRLRYHGDSNKLAAQILQFATDHRLQVRSAATNLAIALTIRAEELPSDEFSQPTERLWCQLSKRHFQWGWSRVQYPMLRVFYKSVNLTMLNEMYDHS